MKHLKSILLTLAALLCSTVASAYSFQVDGIFYYITNNSYNLTVEVTYESDINGIYNTYKGDVVIPATVTYDNKVYKVTEIGTNAFYKCSNLTSVSIPESVRYIDYYAFSGCSSLASITIPNSVTSISNEAFKGCSSLASATVGNSVTSIGNYAFSGCSNLTAVYISDMTAWCNISFGNSSSNPLYCAKNLYLNGELVTELTIPSTLTVIKAYTFYGCTSITSITIPESITSIGSSAFSGCSSIASITIPESITSIGSSAFYGCSSLADVYYAGNLESWMQLSGVSQSSRLNEYANNVYLNGELVREVEIPSTVTAIPDYAFAGFCGLTSITIPESVTSLGYAAFKNCSSLTSITISNSVSSIDGCAFRDCSSLASITIPASVTSIGNNTFNGCTALKDITFEDGSKSLKIGYNSLNNLPLFADCPLESLYLGRNLSHSTGSTYDYPFREHKTLTSAVIGDQVTSIGGNAFYGCNNLASATIGNSVTSIGSSAFQGCSSLASITIPNSVTSIGSSAFHGCSSLASITIPNSVTSIGNEAFKGCSSLASATVGNSVTSIGAYAFSGCSSLASITIPNSVTSIGNYAFEDCSSLASITIPNSVTSIGNYAFSGCSGLKDVIIEDGENDLILGRITNSGYTGYSSGAFYYLSLETLYLGRNLKDVGSNKLSHFGNCKKLESVEIGNTVTNIPSYTFVDCSSLTSVTVPASVTSIGSSAFKGTSIKELILKPTTPPILSASSSLLPDYAVIAVPKEAYNDYSTAAYWTDLVTNITIDDADARVKNLTLKASDDKSSLIAALGEENLKFVTDLTISGSINSYDFMLMRNQMPVLRHLNLKDASIVYNDFQHYTGCHTEDNKFPAYGLYNCMLFSFVFPENITSVGTSGLYGNDKLSEVTIPDGVTSIGAYAFRDCNDLVNVTLPNGVETVGEYAFYNCSKLDTITFLDGLTSIGGCAFEYCNALEMVVLPPTLKTIGGYAFYQCSKLKEIRIPSSVRTVGNYAFSECTSLNDVYVYTVEPFKIDQNTFTKNNGNQFIGTLHAPKVSYWTYFYNTQWNQFANRVDFDEPYENFYLVGDKQLDNTTGAIKGEGDKNPDAEMGNNSGIIVEGDVTQDLGDVDIEHDGENGGSIIVGGEGCVNADELHFHINVKGGRWYFFCFPFDVKREDIKMENGADWVFRYYDGEERAKNGKGGWRNVTSDGNGNHLKAATGYIFQCSKDDVLILTAKNQKIKHEKKYNELVEHITGNAHDASWNFVGNPYLSYYEVSSEDYSAPITVWDGSKYIAIRPGDDDYQLAPFEAFFVQKPEGVANVDYSPERQMTYHQSQEAAAKARARRRTMPVDPARLLVNITLSNGTDTDQTRVVFNNDAALGYEATCDAAKFSTAGMPQLYTVDSRAVKYAINERPAEEGIVTMGYTAPAEGNYTLAAPRMDTPIVVKDNLTGIIHDFSEGDYTFMTQAGTFEDRFTVMTKAGTTGIDRLESTDNSQQPIYDAAGRRVEKMEQGIYIKDNRKVVRL